MFSFLGSSTITCLHLCTNITLYYIVYYLSELMILLLNKSGITLGFCCCHWYCWWYIGSVLITWKYSIYLQIILVQNVLIWNCLQYAWRHLCFHNSHVFIRWLQMEPYIFFSNNVKYLMYGRNSLFSQGAHNQSQMTHRILYD